MLISMDVEIISIHYRDRVNINTRHKQDNKRTQQRCDNEGENTEQVMEQKNLREIVSVFTGVC